MLELIDIDKSFIFEGGSNQILNKVCLRVNAGDYYAVLGPSGVGKSTLLSIMCGLDKPSAGDVRFNGESIIDADVDELVRIRNEEFGFVFQSPYHLNYRTVQENILLPSIYSRRFTRKQALERASYLIHYVGIEGLENRLPAHLSGGELQRMVFARALLLEPKVIFADESAQSSSSAEKSSFDSAFPAANFQPKVLFIDASVASSSNTSTGEKSKFDPKYPAANFEPKVIYP